jgi:hypothetical protein
MCDTTQFSKQVEFFLNHAISIVLFKWDAFFYEKCNKQHVFIWVELSQDKCASSTAIWVWIITLFLRNINYQYSLNELTFSQEACY